MKKSTEINVYQIVNEQNKNKLVLPLSNIYTYHGTVSCTPWPDQNDTVFLFVMFLHGTVSCTPLPDSHGIGFLDHFLFHVPDSDWIFTPSLDFLHVSEILLTTFSRELTVVINWEGVSLIDLCTTIFTEANGTVAKVNAEAWQVPILTWRVLGWWPFFRWFQSRMVPGKKESR